MTQRTTTDASLDQTCDISTMRNWLAAGNLKMSRTDREILRCLAGEVATLTARPIEDKKRELWGNQSDPGCRNDDRW